MDRRGSVMDRRSGKDRRMDTMFLCYFWDGGIERRSWNERREVTERRADWIRVGAWYSINPWDFKRPALALESQTVTRTPLAASSKQT
jgi:hypothetical protein